MFGAFPLGLIPLGSAPFTFETGGEGMLALSDRPFATSPTNVPPNLRYEPRVRVPLVIERTIPLSPSRGSRAALGLGEIVIANADGMFDAMLDGYAIDGRQVRVRVGAPDFDYTEFQEVYVGTAQQWQAVSETDIRISLRDTTWRLAQPLQTNLYLGTGEAEGTAENMAKPKPLCYGTVFNVPAVLIDPARLIYQVHDGPIVGINAVYSNGGSAVAAGETTTDLFSDALEVESGSFVTDVSRGLFRMGDVYGLVTANVAGCVYSGISTSRIVRSIASRLLDEGELDLDSFERLDAEQPAEVGIFIGSQQRPTAAQVIDALMAGIAGWWGSTRLGKIQVGRVSGPSAFTTFRLDETNIIGVEKVDPGAPLNPPPYRWRVGYQRNYAVIDETALSPIIDAQTKQFLSTEWRVAGAFNQDITLKHILASDPPMIPGCFAYQGDAQDEADRLLELWGTDRPVFRILAKTPALMVDIGSSGYVIYPRFGLERGVIVQVIGIRIDGDRNETALTVLAGFPPPVFMPLLLPPSVVGPNIYEYEGSGGAFAGTTGAIIATSLTAQTYRYTSVGGANAAGQAATLIVPRGDTSMTFIAPTPSGGSVSSGTATALYVPVSEAWLPTDLPNLQVWLHPLSGKTLVGSKVSQWNDASGNANHATQPTDANRPTVLPGYVNAYDAVQFDPTSAAQYLVMNGAASNPLNLTTGDDTAFSICYVASVDDTDSPYRILTVTTVGTGRPLMNIAYSGVVQGQAGTLQLGRADDAGVVAVAVSGFYNMVAGQLYVVSHVFSAGRFKTWINGALYADNPCDVGSMGAADMFVIAATRTFGVAWAGKLVEMVIGARTAWSDADRGAFESRAGALYGISIGGGPAWTNPVGVADTIDTNGAAIGYQFLIESNDVLSNDTRDSRTALEIISVETAVGGTASFDPATARITFTPSATTCSFHYTMKDDRNNQSGATVTLTNVVTVSDVALIENFLGGVEVESAIVSRGGTATHIDSAGDVSLDSSNTQRFNYDP